VLYQIKLKMTLASLKLIFSMLDVYGWEQYFTDLTEFSNRNLGLQIHNHSIHVINWQVHFMDIVLNYLKHAGLCREPHSNISGIC